MSKGWYVTRAPATLTLSRHATPRFDLAAETCFAPLRMLPLAHMIRQDMWRALRRLRGFAPVVRVQQIATGLRVTAGGSVVGAVPIRHAEARIRAVLENACNRARWQRCALLTQGKDVL